MEKRPGRTPPAMVPKIPPTGEELAKSIQDKFITDGLPILEANERWRIESRYINIRTCPPGGCPKPGDWPAPRYNLDESD